MTGHRKNKEANGGAESNYNSRKRRWREGKFLRAGIVGGLGVSDKASTSAFGVDLLEPFVLLSLHIRSEYEMQQGKTIRTFLMTQRDARNRHITIAMKPYTVLGCVSAKNTYETMEYLREDIIQRCVCKCSDWSHASGIQLVCRVLACTDAAPNLKKVRSAEIATAF
jgi:hypothetical protein